MLRDAIFGVPIRSCKWQIARTGSIQFCEERLVNSHLTTAKSVCRPCNVKTPHAVDRFVNEAARFIVVRFQSAEPMAEGEHVVFAQIFHIPSSKPDDSEARSTIGSGGITPSGNTYCSM